MKHSHHMLHGQTIPYRTSLIHIRYAEERLITFHQTSNSDLVYNYYIFTFLEDNTLEALLARLRKIFVYSLSDSLRQRWKLLLPKLRICTRSLVGEMIINCFLSFFNRLLELNKLGKF